jgi:hypothetical protein
LKRVPSRINRVISNFTDWFQRVAKWVRQSFRVGNEQVRPMIFRAIFWIGLVAVLMPHEPDLGFGRPGGNQPDMAGEVADWAKAKVTSTGLCRHNGDACSSGTSFIEDLRMAAQRSLAEVKQDIASSAHRRLHDRGG